MVLGNVVDRLPILAHTKTKQGNGDNDLTEINFHNGTKLTLYADDILL